jgi:hypothetical protein
VRRRNLALASALIAALTLAGGTAAHAVWTTSATASASAQAGSIGVSLSDFSGLNASYAAGTTSTQSTFTVTNTGSVPIAATALTLAVSGPTATQQAVSVALWPAQSDGSCGTAPTTTATLAAPPALPATALGTGASAVFCIRTAVPTTAPSGTAGTSVTVVPTVTATSGSWSASQSAAAFTQTISAPASTALQGLCTTARQSAIISWNWVTLGFLAGVGPYDVYLGGTKIDSSVYVLPASYTVSAAVLGQLPHTKTGTQTFELRNVDTGAVVLTANVVLAYSTSTGWTARCP